MTVGQGRWEAAPVIGVHQGLVGETLGKEDGVMLVDESSAVKQGQNSVGVVAQYCGSVGKIANGQVGVYLGYASRKGYSLPAPGPQAQVVEGQLFMPDQWFEDEHTERRNAYGVPEDLGFKTKPKIGLDLLEKAVQRGNLPFSWVAADALYGDSPAFRDGIDALGKWYFTEIRSTTPIWRTCPRVYVPKWNGHGRHPTRLRLRYSSQHPVQVKQVVRHISQKDWVQAVSKKAAKDRSRMNSLFCASPSRAKTCPQKNSG
ncbi:MAG: transposase [Chloroflexi bacterium]|nr:transposase [Chloroflexota bacterium]